MSDDASSHDPARQAVEHAYHAESRRVLATLIRLLGDFDVAEEAMHEAFAVAVARWPLDGVPRQPRAWLVSTARFRAVDQLRRRARLDQIALAVAERLDAEPATPDDDEAIADDRLRLIFTCCHPALAPDAQVALTLREVCGLTTEAIASAFLTKPSTIAQRIVRAKAKIREARIPYEVPGHDALADRLESVLRVVYLLFTEGYAPSSGAALTRVDLSAEGIRLGRLLASLLPHPAVDGLLALMLLHESRRATRTAPDGTLVLLEHQDRRAWNSELIAEGCVLVERALKGGHVSGYALQAAIAALHAQAPTAAATDWPQIVALYDVLLRLEPSPVIALNRAVAVSMRDGAAAGLALIEPLLDLGELVDYHLAHAARADLLRRIGDTARARAAYREALRLVTLEPERRFLEQRLRECDE